MKKLGSTDAELYDPVWLARYRTSHRRTPQFGEGRVFIAGDAGHIHVPIGGQGMNTGIQDAFKLAWKLAYVVTGAARPELLNSYNAERHPVAVALLGGTDRAYRNILHPSELLQNAARLFGPFILNLESVQVRFRNTLEEIEIGYKDSPIVEDCGGSSGPALGERAPDATIVRLSDKETVRLFDVFRGTQWILLLFSGQTTTNVSYQKLADIGKTIASKYGQQQHITTHLVVADAAPPKNLNWDGSILMDREHYLHDKYGVSSACLYLVRPDWYVGFRGHPTDKDSLLNYLAK